MPEAFEIVATKTLILIVMFALASPFVLPVHAAPPPTTDLPLALSAHVPNLARPSAGLYTGGQPDSAAWKPLKAEGVSTVINLRSDEEMRGSDEAARVDAAGMHYVHIPVAGGDAVNRHNAARLHAAMAAAPGKVLVHCASGNRAGALLAIDAADRRHLDTEAAVAYGKSAGLTGLESRVRDVLAKPGVQDDTEAFSVKECTAKYLKTRVGPTGVHASWPVLAELPSQFADADGMLLSDVGRVADGYRYTLFVDESARQAYVVQKGGIVGRTTVFGPLPVRDCSTDDGAAEPAADD